jgi:hypothetical protein
MPGTSPSGVHSGKEHGSGAKVSPQPITMARVVQRSAAPAKTYDEAADAKSKIAAAIAAANVDDIRVLINSGANDDERCAKFAQVLKSSEVTRTRFASVEYKVVNVNVGRLDKNLDLAKTYGATIAEGALPATRSRDCRGLPSSAATARPSSRVQDRRAMSVSRTRLMRSRTSRRCSRI